MKIDWKSLKKFIDDTGLYSYINYVELDINYYVWVYYEGESFSSVLDKGTVDCEDFVNVYKPQAILKNDLAEDGIKYARTIFVGRQRMMHCLFFTLKTSTLETNDPSGFVTIRMKDESGQIIEDGSQAVYTEANFTPHPTNGYGLYGGSIETIDDIETEFVGSAILAPDIPAEMGGQLYFIRNRILKMPQELFTRHAINVGEVPGGVIGANVLRVSIKHDKGIQKKFQIEIIYYI